VLLLFRLVLLLLVFVLPLAVIHGLGDGWFRSWRNENQVEPQVLRFTDSGRSGHNFDGAIGKHGSHFACADRFVYVFPNLRAAGWKASWNHPRRAWRSATGESIMTK